MCSGGCAPGRAGEMNGPSTCAPMTVPPRGSSRSAATSSSAGAEISVGWYAVVPVARIAASAATCSSRPARMKSTPAKPLTWRSTKPGAAIAPPAPAPIPTPAISSPAISTSPGSSRPPTSAAPTPSLIPLRAERTRRPGASRAG
jgi:hypothetical protein